MNSPRMARVLEYLLLHGQATTREIERACEVVAARDYIRRLRDKGHSIETIESRMTETGARVVSYRLASHVNGADLLAHRQAELL